MQRLLSAIILAAAVVALWGHAAFPAVAQVREATYRLPNRAASPVASAALEAQAVGLVNAARRAQGLPALLPNVTLRQIARRHGADMFINGYFSHRSLDGRSPGDRARTAGYRFRVLGENLAYAMDLPAAHGLLMASPAHRRNILSRQYRKIGIAVLDGGASGLIVVQAFSD